jgi:hypothetical protein
MKNPVELLRFNESHKKYAAEFAHLSTTVAYGERRFPASGQYHQLVSDLSRTNNAPSVYELSVLAQRDWHARGQNGCVFARLAALAADSLRWDYIVVSELLQTPGSIVALCAQLDTAIADERCEVVSILFPLTSAPSQAIATIRELSGLSPFWLEYDEVDQGYLRLHLRYPVAGGGIQAWVMAFSPFSFVPNTRRAPYFELVLRTKEKPTEVFHRLNQDRDIAHLADAPLVMSEKYWEDRWRSTLRRTRMILGGEPDNISAARATFAIPIGMLQG